MHFRELKAAGEPDERINTLAAWRETPYFSDAERAALALTEARICVIDSDANQSRMAIRPGGCSTQQAIASPSLAPGGTSQRPTVSGQPSARRTTGWLAGRHVMGSATASESGPAPITLRTPAIGRARPRGTTRAHLFARRNGPYLRERVDEPLDARKRDRVLQQRW